MPKVSIAQIAEQTALSHQEIAAELSRRDATIALAIERRDSMMPLADVLLLEKVADEFIAEHKPKAATAFSKLFDRFRKSEHNEALSKTERYVESLIQFVKKKGSQKQLEQLIESSGRSVDVIEDDCRHVAERIEKQQDLKAERKRQQVLADKKTIREAAEHELQAVIEECYAKHRPLIEKAQADEKRARYDAMAIIDLRRREMELSDGCRDLRLSTAVIDEELESIRRRLSVIQLDGYGWRRQADDAARVIDELGDEVERLKGQSMLSAARHDAPRVARVQRLLLRAPSLDARNQTSERPRADRASGSPRK